MSTKAENLRKWLNTRKPDYNTGMALLLSYTNKPALYAQLSEYKDVAMLRKVLSGLLNEAPTATPKPLRVETKENLNRMAELHAPVKTVLKSVEMAFGQERMRVIDNQQQQLHAEWVGLLKEIEDLKQKLFFIGRDAGTGKPKAKMSADEKEQRREIARLLVGKGGLNEQCMINRDAKRYYEEFGVLPERKHEEPKPVERKVEGDVYLLKENARKMASKLRKKIAATDKPNPDWVVKLQKAEEDLKFYKTQMNAE